jgi:hypothetical protein
MRLLRNSGSDRVVDEIRRHSIESRSLDYVSRGFSLPAFAEIAQFLNDLASCRLILQEIPAAELGVCGSDIDRAARNKLTLKWLAMRCIEWAETRVDFRGVPKAPPQSALVIRRYGSDAADKSISGNCPFTTEGFGVAPGDRMSLIQCSDTPEEAELIAAWFSSLWNSLPPNPESKAAFLRQLDSVACHREASLVYFLTLHSLFQGREDGFDEERVVKTATGIRNTVVWNKLYKFQRDGVVGAIDKLERHGGCIIADSVGLGKTFEALAIIKYYELRNDRVLVLCPKRLRDNWTVYKSNDKRNVLASDRLHYDVLNHTDLSRDGGASGDVDLSFVNWGNYDLVVIDESHNFRNKIAHRDHDSRYDRLMKKIIQSGVKTRVLMLSATPVNNRLADLKNQISFITEGDDEALSGDGIPSIEATIRQAQTQFNRWLTLDDADRKPSRLMDMLGFDYFKLLDLLTIARSRKHIEKYYGTKESGEFPRRLTPVNIKSDVDSSSEFPPIRDINNEIRHLNLSAYAPLRYVFSHKQRAYDEKYSTRIRGGESFFRQADREESLIQLLRVNLLKRMESSVTSFALTVQRQLADVEKLLSKLEAHDPSIEELSIEDIEVDDPAFEPLLIGRKVKVLLQDVDRVKWKQELIEDRNRLATLLSAAQQIEPRRDAKLTRLRELIAAKCQNPINAGNRKVIVFTAFADTAEYLYRELAGWAQGALGLYSAIVTGTGGNKTTLPGIRANLSEILTSFSPRSKERPVEFENEGEINLLIATDCISEGQNLQDCDTLVNYDIHWNPVRIIQRFGRIDRIGSTNAEIQLVNFWPNMELEEYINLEQRVSGRMVLLDVSATGEENLIERRSGDPMNDLEYRRKQLIKLQDAVIDLEDLSSGISIADLTLTDFRIDLGQYLQENTGKLEQLGLGTMAVTTTAGDGDASLPPGVFFCLRAVGDAALNAAEPGYPLAPHYIVHVMDDGTIFLPFTQAKHALDRLKKLCVGRDLPDAMACARFDRETGDGENMGRAQGLLAKAVASIVGKKEERAIASLFSPGGTHARKGEFPGIDDFEVVAFLVVLAAETAGAPGAGATAA